MIDPVSLIFAERSADHAIELSRGSQIVPERLLDDYARPTSFTGLVQPGGFKMFQDRLELIWRDREIKEPVAARPPSLVDLVESCCQTFEAGLITEVALMVED